MKQALCAIEGRWKNYPIKAVVLVRESRSKKFSENMLFVRTVI